MRISIPWLTKYVEIQQSAEELADMLTMLGLEAETPKKPLFTGIVVGHVLEADKHPNADRLKLCIVHDGKAKFQVVCGAPNVAAGQKVPFAKVGAVLGDNFKIAKAKIRGEHSYGMICSERELGISDENEGILVLRDGAKVGEDFAEHINSSQQYLDIDLTPNRPDCMSHVGVSREIAVKIQKKLNYESARPRSYKQNEAEKNISIKIDDKDCCPRYIAGIVHNIDVKPSPDWLVVDLESAGQRSINNIVDISNYVLLEMGHPTHIFDYDKISTKTVGIRNAKKGEIITTLDEKKRKLTNELVITDGKKPIALAGVMGGIESAVTDKTQNVLIESAYFDPVTIRRGSKSLGLSTEASKRFERGADPEGAESAFWRVIELLEELAGGEWVPGINDAYPKKIDQPTIALTREKVDILSGCTFSDAFVKKTLSDLSILVKKDGKGGWMCTPPSFRPDLEREIDIIEELCRIHGYEKIQTRFHFSGIYDIKDVDPNEGHSFIANHLSSVGLRQCFVNSLTNESMSKMESLKSVQMKNPQNENMSHLRTSLYPGLLEIVKHNINNGNNSLALFEIGTDYSKSKNKYNEEERLTAVFHGNRIEKNVHGENEPYSVFSVKGIVQSLLDAAKLTNITFETADLPFYTRSLVIKNVGNHIGSMGQLSGKLIELLDLDSDHVFGFNLDLHPLTLGIKNVTSYESIIPFPIVDRDINFVLDERITSDDVINEIINSRESILISVEPVDIFKHESLGQNKKSVTFHFQFQCDSKTLEDSEINTVMNDITAIVRKKFNAKLRD